MKAFGEDLGKPLDIKGWWKALTDIDTDKLHISQARRLFILPIMLPWWAVQFLCFTCFCGMVSVGLGCIFLLISLVNPEEIPWQVGIFLIILPIGSPFLWWIKYFKNGEYALLFE